MTVYIGNAVCNENGTASGGKPGNQTGKELRKQAWYMNKKGWRVFRAKDPQVAEKIAQAMEAAIANRNIGYDQPTRNTLYDLAKRLGFDPAKVSTPCSTDCSALVRVCIAYAGIKLANFSTASEADTLLKSGKFVELTGADYTDSPDKLKRGDILVTAVKGHTAVVLNDGPKDDKTPEPEPEPTPQPSGEAYVEVIGGSVNVRDADNSNGKVLFTAHRGQTFLYLATAPSGWYQIRTSYGDGCYISNRDDLTKLCGEPIEAAPQTNKLVRVVGGSVRVRDKEDQSGSPIGIAHRGQKFRYLGTAPSGWYHIEYLGRDGYISNKPTLTQLMEA